jgi:hypothetical protein
MGSHLGGEGFGRAVAHLRGARSEASPEEISPERGRESAMSRNVIHSLLAGLGMFGAVCVVEHGLLHVGMPGSETLFDDILLGSFAAFGLYFLLRHRDTGRELRRRQHYALIIAELNHHIRNALQIIVSRADVAIHGMPELDDISSAIDRIDWALREILPRGANPGLDDEGELEVRGASPPGRSKSV